VRGGKRSKRQFTQRGQLKKMDRSRKRETKRFADNAKYAGPATAKGAAIGNEELEDGTWGRGNSMSGVVAVMTRYMGENRLLRRGSR